MYSVFPTKSSIHRGPAISICPSPKGGGEGAGPGTLAWEPDISLGNRDELVPLFLTCSGLASLGQIFSTVSERPEIVPALLGWGGWLSWEEEKMVSRQF